jgi:hypothetical protein
MRGEESFARQEFEEVWNREEERQRIGVGAARKWGRERQI